LRAFFPESTLTELPDGGHFALEDAPEAAAAAVVACLEHRGT